MREVSTSNVWINVFFVQRDANNRVGNNATGGDDRKDAGPPTPDAHTRAALRLGQS